MTFPSKDVKELGICCNSMDYTVHRILPARILECVAYPFSSRSSRPRNWTRVSYIAGGFFTNWAIREAHDVTEEENNSRRILQIIWEVSSVQTLSRVWLFATLWTAACQASLSITNSQSLLKLMSIRLVMPLNHLTLCRPLLLLPSIFPSIRVFSKESVLRIRWPKYWRFSFGIVLPVNIQGWFPLGLMW